MKKLPPCALSIGALILGAGCRTAYPVGVQNFPDADGNSGGNDDAVVSPMRGPQDAGVHDFGLAETAIVDGPVDGPNIYDALLDQATPDAARDTARTAAQAFALNTGLCKPDGWCWVNPLPQGNALQGVWTAANDDIWMVGQAGTIFHGDGKSWFRVDSGVESYLTSIWGAASNDIWAVGTGGTLLHWDGIAWTSRASGTKRNLWQIWGQASDDIWATGDQGAIIHWNGQAWLDRTLAIGDGSARLNGVWGAGSDIWVVGETAQTTGVLMHFNGQTWKSDLPIASPAGFNEALKAIWGSGPSDIWAMGNHGDCYHRTGLGWSHVALGNGDLYNWFASIWGFAANDIWAAGAYGAMHWDATTWTKSDLPYTGGTGVSSIHGRDGNNLWAVGNAGGMFHYDGKHWSPLNSGAQYYVNDVWGASDDEVWAAGFASGIATIFHWDGKTFTPAVESGASNYGYVRISGSSKDDVWALKEYPIGISHWDGKTWTHVPSASIPPYVPGERWSGVWASSPHDIWAVGSKGFIHGDGTSWTRDPATSGGPPYDYVGAVWGSASDDVWAVGGNATVLHWNGKTWSPVVMPVNKGTYFSSVAGTRADDVWIYGSPNSTVPNIPHILHWDGKTWSEIQPPEVDRGTHGALSVAGPNNLWALVGTTAFQWNGSMWSKHGKPAGSVDSLWASSKQVWVFGRPGGFGGNDVLRLRY